MTDDDLRALVETTRCDGWVFTVEAATVRVEKTPRPVDNRGTGLPLFVFGADVQVGADCDRDQAIRRIFATVQFLADHELREQFTVGGGRPFEAHEPPVTGHQRDWFVEHESAVRGY